MSVAKPATVALDRIKGTHPTAIVVERHESSVVADVGGGRRALVSTIGAMHYADNGWQEIDTAWQPAVGAWQYEMTTAPYQASARDAFNVGEIVEYRTRQGEWVRFQPLALNWRDSNNSQQQIAVPQAVATVVTDDVLSWPAGYGAGRHFEWRAHPTRLQKVLKVDSASDLPAPAGYLGTGVELELTFAFTFDASVTAFVDGVAWDRSTTRTTGAAIEFRNAGGDTLWAFTAPRAWDSAGNETTGVMSFYRQGGTRHVAVRFPRAFVDASAFPLYLDPTVTVDVAASGDDGLYNESTPAAYSAINENFIAGFITDDRSSNARWAIAVPQGADVQAATLTLVCRSATSGNTYSRIYAEAADNATQISDATDFNARTRTTAFTQWGSVGSSIPAWTLGVSYASPDFAAAVQEVVDRAGWASGNYLQLFWQYDGSPPDCRRGASWDDTTYDPPSLYVEYTEGEPVTLTPNGFVSASGIVDQGAGSTNLHLAVDETIASTDGDTTYLVNSASSDGNVVLDLTATPSDFGTMNAISISLRVRRE